VKGVGGIGGFLIFKIVSFVVGAIVVGAVMIAVIGKPATGVLYTTGAAYGGQSTRITLDAITTYFANVKQPATTTPGQLTATPKCKKGQKLDPATQVCV
jgi:hypothetical protein